jgi:hypothetical protein
MEIYVYSIRWYCDLSDGGKMLTNSGVIAAKNMGDAVHRLTTELYESVEWVQLYALEGSDYGYADFNDINSLCAEHNLALEE